MRQKWALSTLYRRCIGLSFGRHTRATRALTQRALSAIASSEKFRESIAQFPRWRLKIRRVRVERRSIAAWSRERLAVGSRKCLVEYFTRLEQRWYVMDFRARPRSRHSIILRSNKHRRATLHACGNENRGFPYLNGIFPSLPQNVPRLRVTRAVAVQQRCIGLSVNVRHLAVRAWGKKN